MSITNIPARAKNVAASSFGLFKNSSMKAKLITTLDFCMQVQPNWIAYLVYTSARCSHLTYQYYHANESNRKIIWQKAQVYANTKAVGLLVSQVALTVLGLTTPLSLAIILTWGVVLFSMSMYAHQRANPESTPLG